MKELGYILALQRGVKELGSAKEGGVTELGKLLKEGGVTELGYILALQKKGIASI